MIEWPADCCEMVDIPPIYRIPGLVKRLFAQAPDCFRGHQMRRRVATVVEWIVRAIIARTAIVGGLPSFNWPRNVKTQACYVMDMQESIRQPQGLRAAKAASLVPERCRGVPHQTFFSLLQSSNDQVPLQSRLQGKGSSVPPAYRFSTFSNFEPLAHFILPARKDQ